MEFPLEFAKTERCRSIVQLLRENRYETARRASLAHLDTAEGEEKNALLRLLAEAHSYLGTIREASLSLDRVCAQSPEERFDVLLASARYANLLAGEGFYRQSEEAKAGLSIDEYVEKMRRIRDEKLAELAGIAFTQEQKAAAEALLLYCKKSAHSVERISSRNVPLQSEKTGVLRGRITTASGQPLHPAKVTLGLKGAWCEPDPSEIFFHSIGYEPDRGGQEALVTETNEEGIYHFEAVPVGLHEFLAVTLDPEKVEIVTRYVARDLAIEEGKTLVQDAMVEDWVSAPPRLSPLDLPENYCVGENHGQCVVRLPLYNPFWYDFPRQRITLDFPEGYDFLEERLLLLNEKEESVPFQVVGRSVAFMAALPPKGESLYGLYLLEKSSTPIRDERIATFSADPENEGVAVIDSGTAQFRIPWKNVVPLPPLLGVRGVDQVWRGQGRFVLPENLFISSQETRLLRSGPVVVEVEVVTHLSNGQTHRLAFEAHAGESTLLVHEKTEALEGASFEFSLMEFSGGRGFLHWTSENGAVHWTQLAAEDRELARIQESVPWWIPPAGFGYAVTKDGLGEADYIGLFSMRRGEWIDRDFEALTRGPIDADGKEDRELDWPFPEMVGSTISMITAHSTSAGDVYFKFPFFNGERRWGILASDLARNDGRYKEIAKVQHKNSSPRLEDFKNWKIDEQDRIQRPGVVAKRDHLIHLRKKRNHPLFAKIWQRIENEGVRGPIEGFRFAVEGDPLVGWAKKRALLHHAEVRARMLFLGRDISDVYSPVGGRSFYPLAYDYDLIAASGAFTPEEERLMRAFFTVVGHQFMSADLMNWRYNSRNANFETDRIEVVGAMGLILAGTPDGETFLTHAGERLLAGLNAYCTPGSGKWYENPACYYLVSLKGRTIFHYHLQELGRLDVTKIERFRDFLMWGIHLLTPPQISSYYKMRDGCSEEEWDRFEKVRKIPPIGDHAGLGRWLPEQYVLMAKLYREAAPEFSKALLGAWYSASGDGQRMLVDQEGFDHPGEAPFYPGGSAFGDYCSFFAEVEPEDLQWVPEPEFKSQRLSGFGSLFRDKVGTKEEFYLLFKCGPGGYRYHRTEGSIILFANGKPLLYDGGEAGEAWRHSTLSFYPVRMPLSAGTVAAWQHFDSLDFSQGVFPRLVAPGTPIFLSDSCEHTLVAEAYARKAETNHPASRAVWQVESEYVVIHDELNLPSDLETHWHLQVVADSESGSVFSPEGCRFKGRFETDLQVLLPGQSSEAEGVEEVPFIEVGAIPEGFRPFAQRHLQLTAHSPKGFLAVLRPLPKGAAALHAELLQTGEGKNAGAHVTTADGRVNDWILSACKGAVFENREGNLQFSGKAGSVIQRRGRLRLSLMGEGNLRWGSTQVQSTGPGVDLTLFKDGTLRLLAKGEGEVTISHLGQTLHERIEGESELRLPLRV